ncbi:MAG: hypothetical protein A4E28_02935 [Methanocella sp. PtaU1.Bin125]|nr:MAG: hypothetical protein A4E28_02935 [Methanocella sp. PtaU1.Bin125]
MEERGRRAPPGRVAPGQGQEDFECVPAKEKRAAPEKLDRGRRAGRGLPILNP